MYDGNKLYIHMYMTNTHCKYHHTWFEEGTRRGFTFEILGLKESHFEGEIQAKFFALVTCIV